MKLEEMVRLRGLCICFLTTKRRSGLEGMIHYRAVTKKYMGDLMKNKGCFNEVYLCNVNFLPSMI